MNPPEAAVLPLIYRREWWGHHGILPTFWLSALYLLSLTFELFFFSGEFPFAQPPPPKKNPRIYLSHFNVSKVFWYLLSYDPHSGCMRWVDWVNQEHGLSFTGHTVGCYRVAVKPRSLSPSSFLPWILLQMNYLTALFIFALVWRKLIKAILCFLLSYLMIV